MASNTSLQRCNMADVPVVIAVQDTKEEEEAYKTPSKQGREKDPIRGVRLGASDRSYLLHDNKISVLRNVHGGVQDTGLSFDSPQVSTDRFAVSGSVCFSVHMVSDHRCTCRLARPRQAIRTRA